MTMGLLDRILGRDDDKRDERQQGYPAQEPGAAYPPPPSGPYQDQTPDQGGQPYQGQHAAQQGQQSSEDERAIARYKYLLRTAPPEKVEQAHAEAFGKLSPEQRQQVLAQLTNELPQGEAPQSDDPQAMARAATRAEMQQPGYLQRSFAGSGGSGGRGGPGMGSMFAGSMMGTVAGVVVGSMVAQSLFGGYEQSPEAGEVGEAGEGDAGAEGAEAGGDFGGGDFGGGDFGGGFGDF